MPKRSFKFKYQTEVQNDVKKIIQEINRVRSIDSPFAADIILKINKVIEVIHNTEGLANKLKDNNTFCRQIMAMFIELNLPIRINDKIYIELNYYETIADIVIKNAEIDLARSSPNQEIRKGFYNLFLKINSDFKEIKTIDSSKNGEMANQFAIQQQKISQLEQQNRELRVELENNVKENLNLKSQSANSEIIISILQIEISDLQHKLINLMEEMPDPSNLITVLEKEKIELINKIEEQSLIIINLKDLIEVLTKERTRNQEDLKYYSNSFGPINQNEGGEKSNSNKVILEELEAYRTKMLKMQNDIKTEEIKALTNNINEIKLAHEKLSDIYNLKHGEIESYKSINEKLNQDAIAYNQEIEILKKKVQKLNTDILGLLKDVEFIDKTKDETINCLLNNITFLEETIRMYQDDKKRMLDQEQKEIESNDDNEIDEDCAEHNSSESDLDAGGEEGLEGNNSDEPGEINNLNDQFTTDTTNTSSIVSSLSSSRRGSISSDNGFSFVKLVTCSSTHSNSTEKFCQNRTEINTSLVP